MLTLFNVKGNILRIVYFNTIKEFQYKNWAPGWAICGK